MSHILKISNFKFFVALVASIPTVAGHTVIGLLEHFVTSCAAKTRLVVRFPARTDIFRLIHRLSANATLGILFKRVVKARSFRALLGRARRQIRLPSALDLDAWVLAFHQRDNHVVVLALPQVLSRILDHLPMGTAAQHTPT